MSRQEREAGTTETEGSGGRWGQAYVLGIIWTPDWNCRVNVSAKTC